ncbi:MAG: glycosyltransferase family 2 protein [Cyanobacteria bacterium P01_A01_bin.37]
MTNQALNQFPDLVSVVITTYKRPHLVTRAIQSVLAQTLQEIEVIVIVDGPDPEAEAVLRQINDPKFRFVVLPQNVKLAGARNAGVKEAKGPWVAFLDDDDEWLPNKLELQLKAAKASQYTYPIVSSRILNKTPKGDFVWPRRFPRPSEHMSDYLFVRRFFVQGEGFILPSTYFTKRELLLKHPFVHNKHEDYDWFLKVVAAEDVGVDYIPEVTAIWHSHTELGRQRLGQVKNWKYSLEWIQSARLFVTPRAYASFVLIYVGSQAAGQLDWGAFGFLLKEALREGNPRIIDFIHYSVLWLFPEQVRKSLKAMLSGKSTPSKQTDDKVPSVQ